MNKATVIRDTEKFVERKCKNKLYQERRYDIKEIRCRIIISQLLLK